MDKNENGYPNLGGSMGGDGCSRNNVGQNGNTDARQNGNTVGNGNCGGTGCVDAFPLAYVYAPNQSFRMLYSAEEALKHGTLFEELYKPKEVYGRE